MLYFDHSYTFDKNHTFLKRLEMLGFHIVERRVEHPGKHFCRFIFFPCPEGHRKMNYLEFVNIGSGGIKMPHPGLSLGYTRDLEKFVAELKRKGRLKAELTHKNYDWKKDSKSRLPGWNFATFPALKSRGFYTWLTEYEPSSKRKSSRPPAHPNGVERIVGLDIEISPNDEKFLRALLGGSIGVARTLHGGTVLRFRKGRRSRLATIRLECKSLKKFTRVSGLETNCEISGKPAVQIKNPAKMWDLIVMERQSREA